MKTDDLISVLAADRELSGQSIASATGMALAAGMAVSVAAFVAMLGIRPDIGAALQSWRFDAKLGIAAVAVVAALIDCMRSMEPQPAKAPAVSLIVLGLLAAAVAIELAAVSSGEWRTLAMGTNAVVCLLSIPLLSLAPLVVLLWAMRSAAPQSPARAGAGIGVLAAACGAALYATHCFDDSPLFVAIWYSLAAVPVIAIGTLAGSRMLRW